MLASANSYRSQRSSATDEGLKTVTAPEITDGVSAEEVEQYFQEAIRQPLDQAAKIGEADIVIGIPFYNEVETIGNVIKTIRRGLEKFYQRQKCVIVAVGAPVGEKALKEAITALPRSSKISQIAFLLNDEKISGKGWAFRAIMEIARSLGADLAILEADLESREKDGETQGLSPDWVQLLLEPIKKEEMDLVVSRFNRHYFEAPIATHLVYPLLAAIYNRPIPDPLGGQWGISYRLLRTYLKEPGYLWQGDIGRYGIDGWLLTKAITGNAQICESNLGLKIHRSRLLVAKTELILRQLAGVLCQQIVADRAWWRAAEETGEAPLLQPIPVFGVKKIRQVDEVQVVPEELMAKYQRGFNKYHALYQGVFHESVYQQLERLAVAESNEFNFPPALWVQIVYHLLVAIASGTEFARGDLLSSFIPLYEGRVASFARQIQALKDKLQASLPDEAENLVSLEAGRQVEELVNEFLLQKPGLMAAWEMQEVVLKPPVPKVTYREFIPGVSLVVPLEKMTPEGELVTANGIYDAIFREYQKEFEYFVHERLKLPEGAGSLEITARILDFMRQVESDLDSILLPGDMSTVAGTQQMVDAILHYFPERDAFVMTPEMALWLLQQQPPSDLFTKLGYSNLNALLTRYQPNDVLAMACWAEEREYFNQVWTLVKKNLRPEHFGRFPLEPLVVSHEVFPALIEMEESGALCKLAGRMVIGSLHKGMGGEFPKIHYFTHLAKNIIEFGRFGQAWQKFAEERKDFGEKIVNSLEGHWGREPLSAHSMFENGHQRLLVERLRKMAQQVRREARKDSARLAVAERLGDVASSYHLALTLPDGTFMPCSIWTWASYSFKGGTGVPTPLSLHVERDWASREFLTRYFEAIGGKEDWIDDKITELQEEGREWEDMAAILLGGVKEAKAVVGERTTSPEQPPAGTLTRFGGNPVLEPVREHPWESKYVLNPGAISLNGKTYLVYRALGEDNISRLGLAVSKDGLKFTERLDTPIFEPKGKAETKGCEDPRLTIIGDRIYMAYTAYDGLVAQIAFASIEVKDFLDYRWEGWRRHGLVFPGFTDKDGALFPERFGGQFYMLHRVDPHIWITFSSHLRCPWSHKKHTILAGAMSGMAWDGNKIGAGAQPLKTKYGWLLVTHGNDYDHVYRLGVMLLDLADPTVLLYRSPNPVLEPEEAYEMGEVGKSWVHNVVFTCGAVPRQGAGEILDARDEILVYYGAADTVIGVARAKIADLIPVKSLSKVA